MNEKIRIKIIELIQFGSKRVIGDILKNKLIDKSENDKIMQLRKDVNKDNIITEDNVIERIGDYIDKSIYNDIININTSANLKNHFIEDFFKQNDKFIIYRKNIEKVLEEYCEKVEQYKNSILTKSQIIIKNSIDEVAIDSKINHKRTIKELKETEQSVIREIRKKDKLGMIRIEENGIINFKTHDVEGNLEDAKYNFFGETVDFTDSSKIECKLMMNLKIKNVGTDFLCNIIVKKFEINSIDAFENDSYNFTEVCSYRDNIIKNAILPGTNSQLYFIFDPFNLEGNFDENIFKELSEQLDINFSFDIKLNDGNIITQEFQIYCSKIDECSNNYSIDSVTNIFNIKDK
ncbi:hypothetical protein KTC97_17450 [Clostridium estertheticum]|nr:hypothetical protein [Clostridium estertheticum]WLC83820.1 hypothetical protein KTC97_17450 [Clostridium estertheticum]